LTAALVHVFVPTAERKTLMSGLPSGRVKRIELGWDQKIAADQRVSKCE